MKIYKLICFRNISIFKDLLGHKLNCLMYTGAERMSESERESICANKRERVSERENKTKTVQIVVSTCERGN